MTSEKLDRRKKYTRMVLRESLLELMRKKPFSSITVKEICSLADINRSTFYAHYQDQYELLETIESEIITDMKEYLSTYNLKEREDALRMTEKLIEYFAAKKEELQILLNAKGENSFERKVMDIAKAFIMDEWMESKEMDTQISRYVSSFIISGSVEVMKMWLLEGMEESPKEMAELINGMINHGIYGEMDDKT